MSMHIDITGVRYTPDELTKRYVRKKLGGLERYLPRHARKTFRVEVRLRDVNRTRGNKYECDAVVHVPDATFTAKDSTLNMLAAIDIVEAKLKNQLKRYHDDRKNHRGKHNFLSRFKRRPYRPQTSV